MIRVLSGEKLSHFITEDIFISWLVIWSRTIPEPRSVIVDGMGEWWLASDGS